MAKKKAKKPTGGAAIKVVSGEEEPKARGKQASPETLAVRAIIAKIPKAELAKTTAGSLKEAIEKEGIPFKLPTVNNELNKAKAGAGLKKKKKKIKAKPQTAEVADGPSAAHALTRAVDFVEAAGSFTEAHELLDRLALVGKTLSKIGQ